MATLPVINDRAFRGVGIAVLGLVIPAFTGLLGNHGPKRAAFWGGLLLCVALAALLWHGQRFLLIKQHEHSDWFASPVQKLLLLVVALGFGTIPVTLLMGLLWYRLVGAAPDWAAITSVVYITLIATVFVTYAYDALYFNRAREQQAREEERFLRLRAEAEVEALEAQLDPDLVFNAAAALGRLIGSDPKRAAELSATLGRVHAYLLASRARDLVRLSEEMAFVKDYLALLAVRFEGAIVFDIRVDAPMGSALLHERLLPPVALQSLVENAVRQNEFSRQHPLRIDVRVRTGEVVMSSVRQPRGDRRLPTPPDQPVAQSAAQFAASDDLHLRLLGERFRLATAADIAVTSLPDRLSVHLPLVAA